MRSSVTPWRVPGRIAYIVNHSYPYSSNGYAVRTHGIANALVQLGHSVIVMNRPGAPGDISGFEEANQPDNQWIDGVLYLFKPEPSRRTLKSEAWLEAATTTLQATLQIFKPSAVMAASNWQNALPALNAARVLRLPFYYEVRGFWEITRISREPEWQQTDEYQQTVAQETHIASQADHVFTLTRQMQDELVRRGISNESISLLPNGYPALPLLRQPPKISRNDIGIHTRYIIGYLGSFNAYEGLEDLIRATAQLVKTGLDITLLLVGSGSASGLLGAACPFTQEYRKLAEQHGLGNRLLTPGRLNPNQLADYYPLLDIVIIPRRPLPVTEIVSPIKPLEVAAYGRPLLMSDVAPLADIARESGAALFNKGDEEHLASQIKKLLLDENGRKQMGQQLRQWVGRERLFNVIARPIQAKIHAARNTQRCTALIF